MRVSIEELRLLCDKLFSHLDQIGVTSVELTKDYYWEVPQDLRSDPYREPTEHTLGQLTDDWSELRKVLDGSTEPIGYHLVWLSAVLRAIGEEVVG